MRNDEEFQRFAIFACMCLKGDVTDAGMLPIVKWFEENSSVKVGGIRKSGRFYNFFLAEMQSRGDVYTSYTEWELRIKMAEDQSFLQYVDFLIEGDRRCPLRHYAPPPTASRPHIPDITKKTVTRYRIVNGYRQGYQTYVNDPHSIEVRNKYIKRYQRNIDVYKSRVAEFERNGFWTGDADQASPDLKDSVEAYSAFLSEKERQSPLFTEFARWLYEKSPAGQRELQQKREREERELELQRQREEGKARREKQKQEQAEQRRKLKREELARQAAEELARLMGEGAQSPHVQDESELPCKIPACQDSSFDNVPVAKSQAHTTGGAKSRGRKRNKVEGQI